MQPTKIFTLGRKIIMVENEKEENENTKENATNTKPNFRKYYFNEMKTELEELEDIRKGIWKKAIIGLFVIIGINILISIFINIQIIAIVLSIAIFGAMVKFISKDFRKVFKDKIIKNIVAFISEDLHYNMNGFISKTEFMNSKIFNNRIDIYRGEDMVYGKIDKTEIKFSEVLAQYITKDSKGNRHTHTLFDGILFMADFNKDFTSVVQIKPDIAENLFGRFGSRLQKMSTFGSTNELIKLEDPVFEKYFAVYSPNQIEARYILSPKLMERIVKIRESFNKKMFLSFVNSTMYIAIPYKEDLFEPKIFSSMVNLKQTEEYYNLLKSLIGIVEELDLNTRIWTKE